MEITVTEAQYKKIVKKSFDDFIHSMTANFEDTSEGTLFQQGYYLRVFCIFLHHYMKDIKNIKVWNEDEQAINSIANFTKHYHPLKDKKNEDFRGAHFNSLETLKKASSRLAIALGLKTFTRFTLKKTISTDALPQEMGEVAFRVYKKYFSGEKPC